MKKFKLHAWKMEIEEFEIIRETPEFVVFHDEWRKKERREAKAGTYFDTFEDAKAHIVSGWERRVKNLNDQRSDAIDKLGKAKALKVTARTEVTSEAEAK